jgi:single-strand DNA-binding protein
MARRGLLADLVTGGGGVAFLPAERGREWKKNDYVNLSSAGAIDSLGGATDAPADDDGAPLPEEPGTPVDEDVPF